MAGTFADAAAAGKLQVIDWGLADGLGVLLTSPYALPVSLVGGAVFAMASHGTDQLIVQRILACRTLAEGRKAMVWSGVFVILQFGLFLFVGLALWVHYGGAPLAELGLERGDELFPRYILDEMPAGLRGLLFAGIIAAAMSTLSSSLNALAGSTLMDLLERVGRRPTDPARALALSRVLTLVWATVFVGFAMLFTGMDNPVVELGLGIAGFTYGGLLGAFLLGLLSRRARQSDAAVAFVVAIVLMALVIFGVRFSTVEAGWVWAWQPDAGLVEARGLRAVAWPLYPVIGSAITVGLGFLLALRHPGADPKTTASQASMSILDKLGLAPKSNRYSRRAGLRTDKRRPAEARMGRADVLARVGPVRGAGGPGAAGVPQRRRLRRVGARRRGVEGGRRRRPVRLLDPAARGPDPGPPRLRPPV